MPQLQRKHPGAGKAASFTGLDFAAEAIPEFEASRSLLQQSIRYGMLEALRKPRPEFADVIRRHFMLRKACATTANGLH